VKGKLVKEDCPLAFHGGVGPGCFRVGDA